MGTLRWRLHVAVGVISIALMVAGGAPAASYAQSQTSKIAPPGSNLLPSWSPDGRRIAFLSTRHGQAELYTMAPDGSDQRRLTVSQADIEEFRWSPDGRCLVFVSTRSGRSDIHLIGVDGGEPRQLTSSGRENSPTWAPDSQRIAFVSNRDGTKQIYVMRADGTDQRRITAFRGSRDTEPVTLAWSPDGRHFAFWAMDLVEQTSGMFQVTTVVERIYLMRADGTGLARLVPSNNNIDGFAWSPDGRQLTVDGRLEGSWQVYAFTIETGERRRLTDLGQNGGSVWSSDGRRIAFISDRDGGLQIYVMGADGGGQSKLTTVGRNYGPAWSPDGRWIAFTSRRDGTPQVYVINADGSGETRLTNPP